MSDKTSHAESQTLLRSRRRYTELDFCLEKHRNLPLPYLTFPVALNNFSQIMKETIKSFTFSMSSKAITLDLLNTLVNSFIQLPNLKTIKMLCVQGPMIDSLDVTRKPKFTHLEDLVFEDCDIKLLSFFSKAQLKILGVLSPVNCQPSSQQRFWEFLSNQQKLEVLDSSFSRQFGVNSLFRSPFKALINFELTEFSLRAVKLDSRSDFKNVLIFLNLHADNLENVELGKKFPDFIYSFVFAKLKKLKTLYLMANDVPNTPEFFSQLHANESIKNLILSHHVNAGKCNEDSIKLISHLPNLGDLSLLMPYNTNVHSLIVNCSKQLKCLKRVFIEVPYDINLAHLELPPVEAVEIHCSEEIPKFLQKKTAPKNEKLRSLHYNGPVHQNFCNVIKKIFPNLTNLEICKSEIQVDHSLLPVIRVLRFRDNSFFERDDVFYESEYLEDGEELDDDKESTDESS